MSSRCLAGFLSVLFCAWLQVLPAQADDVERGALAARFDAPAVGGIATQAVPGAIAALARGDEAILPGWGFPDLDAGTRAGPDDVRFGMG